MAASIYDPAGALEGPCPKEVKRETGESPVRTRHCEQGVLQSGMPLSDREGGCRMKICESGDLPAELSGAPGPRVTGRNR